MVGVSLQPVRGTEQRVPLTPQPDWPHDITLYFTGEELRDMCQRIVGKRGYTIDLDVLEHSS